MRVRFLLPLPKKARDIIACFFIYETYIIAKRLVMVQFKTMLKPIDEAIVSVYNRSCIYEKRGKDL